MQLVINLCKKKIIENQFHHYEPVYIYKVNDKPKLNYECKNFEDLYKFEDYLKICIKNFKRDFSVDKFVRVNDVINKDVIYQICPFSRSDSNINYNYKQGPVKVKTKGNYTETIFNKFQILSANEDGNPFDENFYGNFPYYVKINNEVHCLSLKKIQNENHTYVETLMIELVYENDLGLKIKSFKFIDFLKDPSSDSHFKKKASPKKKRASPKKKRASPKKKRASQKKKKSSRQINMS
jgi:hypothetical protein